jgi:hypothetical protein
MPSAAFKVLWMDIQSAKLVQIAGPQPGKLIQQLRQRLAFTFARLCPAIKGHKGLGLAMLQNHPGPRHPICTLAVNQMADNVKRAPGVFTFIA